MSMINKKRGLGQKVGAFRLNTPFCGRFVSVTLIIYLVGGFGSLYVGTPLAQ